MGRIGIPVYRAIPEYRILPRVRNVELLNFGRNCIPGFSSFYLGYDVCVSLGVELLTLGWKCIPGFRSTWI